MEPRQWPNAKTLRPILVSIPGGLGVAQEFLEPPSANVYQESLVKVPITEPKLATAAG